MPSASNFVCFWYTSIRSDQKDVKDSIDGREQEDTDLKSECKSMYFSGMQMQGDLI